MVVVVVVWGSVGCENCCVQLLDRASADWVLATALY